MVLLIILLLIIITRLLVILLALRTKWFLNIQYKKKKKQISGNFKIFTPHFFFHPYKVTKGVVFSPKNPTTPATRAVIFWGTWNPIPPSCDANSWGCHPLSLFTWSWYFFEEKKRGLKILGWKYDDIMSFSQNRWVFLFTKVFDAYFCFSYPPPFVWRRTSDRKMRKVLSLANSKAECSNHNMKTFPCSTSNFAAKKNFPKFLRV